jgi:hypothetical protein
MKPFRVCAIFLAILFCRSIIFDHSFAQQKPPIDDNEILARIGPRIITVRDLVERIELMPWPGKENPATRDSAKVKALFSLVAEKLMAMQAVEQGFVFNSGNSPALRALERVLARDQLYRAEVLSKIEVTQSEIRTGLQRYAHQLRLHSFLMNSEEDALQLARTLSARRDSTAPALPTAGVISDDTLMISFSDLHPILEDSAYALNVNEASAAFTPELGWTVFHLLSKSINPAYAQATFEQRQYAVRQKIKKRKERDIGQAYLRAFFSDKTSMDSARFNILADSLLVIMKRDSAGHFKEGAFGIRNDDIEHLHRALAALHSQPIISMGSYSISVEEIINELRFHPVRFQSLRHRSFLETLNSAMQEIAGSALHSSEAISRRFNQQPNAQRDLNVWVDAMEAEKLLRHLIDSLGRSYGVDHEINRVDSLEVSNNQAEAKATEALNAIIGKLAQNYGVEMDLDKLKRVPLFQSNMVTRRLIGFGGSMMASPMLLRLWDWMRVWQKSKQIAP